MQREGGEGGSVYLRLSTRTLDQPQRMMTPDLQAAITEGAYWLRKPGPNAEVVIAYTGAVAPEAIEAVGLLGESRRDIGLLAITSADRLHAGWTAARSLRRDRRGVAHLSHIEKLLAPLPRDCGIVTVIDGHPAALAGSAACAATASKRSASSISARPAPSTTSIATTASTPTPSSTRRKASRPARRCGIGRWRCESSQRKQGPIRRGDHCFARSETTSLTSNAGGYGFLLSQERPQG